MKKELKRFRKRLLLSAAVWLGFCFTFLFFGPLELVAFSGDSLVYGYRDVLWPLVMLSVCLWLAATVLTALLKGAAFRVALAICSGVTVCGYLQSVLLNGEMGRLTGDAVALDPLAASLGFGLWCCILTALLLLMHFKRKVFRKVVVIAALVLTAMQFAPTVGILSGAYEQAQTEEDRSCLSDEGFYEFSSDKNVVVVVLDRLDYDYVEAALRTDPDLFADFEGFTVYNNALSAYARTRPALLHMLTGAEDLIYQTSFWDLYRDAWSYEGWSLPEDIQAAGYTAEFYTKLHYLFSDTGYARQFALNYHSGKQEINAPLVVSKLMGLSAYRYSPAILKNLFWADTNFYNEDALVASEINAYEFDDLEYMPGFSQIRAGRSAGSFKFYHFHGPHAPYTMDENGGENSEGTSSERQLRGNLKYLTDLFAQMKAKGIYDRATIIITGDHGAAVSDMKAVQKETRVGIFYKPAGASGEAVFSSAPVRTSDIPATVLKAMGVDYSKYGPALDEIPEDQDRVRRYYKTIYTGDPLKEAYCYTYEIRGDASVFENWVLVEEGEIPYGYN